MVMLMMTDAVSFGVDPANREQQAALLTAAGLLRAQIPPGCDRIEYNASFLANAVHTYASGFTPDGDQVMVTPLFDTNAAFRVLRALMFQSGHGTWFKVRMTVQTDGTHEEAFNQEHVPDIEPYVDYVTDQHMFPIDEDKQPKWLKPRLALGVQWLRDHDERWYPQWLYDMIQAGNKPDWL